MKERLAAFTGIYCFVALIVVIASGDVLESFLDTLKGVLR